MKYLNKTILLFLTFFYSLFVYSQNDDITKMVTHHYANNNGVKIHYVAMGEGPLILFVHGFPDFWYTWRHQMVALSKTHRVVAMDLRGYNLSDSPDGSENYTYNYLTKDILAVIKDTGKSEANIVAHDWGAAISWNFAAFYPEYVDKLIVLSIAHPKAGDKKEPKLNEGKEPSYADYFVSEKFKNQLNENWFSGWVKNLETKEIYKEAFKRSDKEAMINYYRANFPTLDNLKDSKFIERRQNPYPNIKSPVLVIHGKKDIYALTKSHNNTWNFIDNELTIKILPNAGHFIQRDESNEVTRLIEHFLKYE